MREVKHEVFILKRTEYSDKKIATTIPFPAVTNLNLWLNKNGLVIGLDFITVEDK